MYIYKQTHVYMDNQLQNILKHFNMQTHKDKPASHLASCKATVKFFYTVCERIFHMILYVCVDIIYIFFLIH